MDWSDLGLPSPPPKEMLLDEKENEIITSFIHELRDEVPDEDRKRVDHVRAEKKRRGKIKNEFELLSSLLPSLNDGSLTVRCTQSKILHEGKKPHLFYSHPVY